MISPATCVTMIMFAGSGLYLYQAKHHAEVETREIRRLVAETDATRQRAIRLITEYQLESDQEQLTDLATRFQPQLKPTQPTQFTNAAELEHRLPPVGLPAPVATPNETDLVYAYPPAPFLAFGPPVPPSVDAARPAITAAKASGSAVDVSGKPKAPARTVGQPVAREPAVPSLDPTQYAASGHPVTSAPIASAPTSSAPNMSARIAPAVSTMPLGARPTQPQYSAVVATTPMYPFGAQYASPYGGPAPTSGSALGMARVTPPRPYVPAMTPPLAPGGTGG